MEAPISASVGAMGSLLGKLDEILATEHKDEIWKLREDLEVTRTLLLKLSKARDPPVTARYWMKDVRELSYDMEDCVDAETDWIDEKMSGFKTRVEEANERYLSYKLEDSVPICADVAIDYRLPTVDGRKAVVGLHAKGGPIERLCQSLSDQDAKLKVVSIVGVGGIGKTTLAEQLWHRLGGAFQCRAFVQTCKKPDMRSILRSILSQVRPHQPPGVTDVHKLTQDICEHLQDKSYFVIIDDLWATSVWEVLSRSFPEGNHGSRIITTTEAEDVALACCAYQPTYIFEMQPLSVQHSEELFTSALFGSRVKQLDECSHEIMRRCGGLPQAIVSIASILASNQGTETSENTGEQWNYLQNFVLNDLGADIPFEEILKQVLNLCYNSLPSCLQTCLLYLSLYSENYIIFKEDLTKQWIVEGFICASTKKQTMEVARSYFDKLVIMGLIRHIDVKNGDEVLSYAVHHMVHDFITFKSIEVNFITVMDYSQSTIQLSDKVRRLSLQFGSAAYANTPASTRLSQVRSLSFIGLVKCMPSISEFKLLRVLILNLWGDQGSTFDLTRISELFLLRYLQIICNVIVQLPDQMQGLEHMETLEINARPDWSLSHLRLGGGTNQPDATLYPSDSSSEPFDPVKTFELLPPICSLPKWIGQLNKLCTLKIVVRELLKDDISCLGGLPTLTILSLYVRQHTAEIIVFNTAQFAALEYFEFRCGVLSLAFQEGAMPNLQMLKLGFNAHKGEQYGHFLAGIEHLSNLKEVAGIIGVADGAEEPDWRAAESAFKDAIQLAGEVNVKRADWIEEEYSSPKNQHFIQEKHPSSEQPGNIKEESDEDIERNSDMKQKESISSYSPPTLELNTANEDSSQAMVVGNADETGQGSPKNKRHKFDDGDGTSCKRCSCKKSKCLKLYCECFHAGVFCSEPCSCQGCLNKPSNMETVLATREQIESRNPLAFAPKVIRSSEPGHELLGEYSNKTPASARHKRGCNCKKSSCLKKYCECYQGGVGCSISCRCEGCKNAFGKREGVPLLSVDEVKLGYEEDSALAKEEKNENDNQLVINQAANPAPAENVLTTPSVINIRPLASLPPTSSKKRPRSSTKLLGHSPRLSNSQAPSKADILLSPFENYSAEMVWGAGTSDSLKGGLSPQTSVKVVSPNKKRVSPPRIGTGLSPICKSGRKLILKSIPSFPSLCGDVNNADLETTLPAP